MTTSDLLISKFLTKQKEFCYLQTLSLRRDIYENSCSEYNADVVLCAYPFSQHNKKLEVKFTGIRDLRIGKIDGLFALLITINDVSGDQLENINYSVKEDENGLFSFYCRNFSYKEI